MSLKKISLSLDEELWGDFRKFCMSHDIKMSVVIEQLIIDFLFAMELKEIENKDEALS